MIQTHSMALLVTYDKSSALIGFIEKNGGRIRVMEVKNADGAWKLAVQVPETIVAELKKYEYVDVKRNGRNHK